MNERSATVCVVFRPEDGKRCTLSRHAGMIGAGAIVIVAVAALSVLIAMIAAAL